MNFSCGFHHCSLILLSLLFFPSTTALQWVQKEFEESRELQTVEVVTSLGSASAKSWYLHLSAFSPTCLSLFSVPLPQAQWLHDSLASAAGLRWYYCLITYRECVVNPYSCFLKNFIHLQQKVNCLSKPWEQHGCGMLFSLAESTEGSSGVTSTPAAFKTAWVSRSSFATGWTEKGFWPQAGGTVLSSRSTARCPSKVPRACFCITESYLSQSNSLSAAFAKEKNHSRKMLQSA